MKVRVGAATDTGRVRPANEDTYLADEALGLYAVADGMGGHRAGEVASSTAVEALRAGYAPGQPGKEIADAVVRANASVFERSGTDPQLQGMGTTLTAIGFNDLRARIAHVGDSRAYLWRDGELTRVTEDHSFVEDMVRQGRLTPDEAITHPRRSLLTRALGIEAHVDVDQFDLDLLANDRILLCSDGLTSMVHEREIVGSLRRERDPQRAAQALVDLANEAGGDDNITAVVLDIVDDDGALDAQLRAASSSAGPSGLESPATSMSTNAPGSPRTDSPPARDTESPVSRVRARQDDAIREARRRAGRRALGIVIPLLVIVIVGLVAVVYVADHSYYVGFDDQERVTIYQGVEGGLLWLDPSVSETFDDLTRAQIANSPSGPIVDQLRIIDGKKKFSDRDAAVRYIDDLRQRMVAATTGLTATTTSSAPTAATPTSISTSASLTTGPGEGGANSTPFGTTTPSRT